MGVWAMWRRVVVGMAVCVAGGLTLASSPAIGAGPRITAVTFSGSQAHPVITIVGSGFGDRPSPDPGYHPPWPTHRLCPVRPTKPLADYGFDYGAHLFLTDSTQHPGWAAGRYRPGIGELDCIGLLITQYTPTKIVYQLGAAYPNVPTAPAKYALAAGDSYVVGVNGATFSGRVRYS